MGHAPRPFPPTLKVLRWNFLKTTKGGGFIFLEDGSALRFEFLRDGRLWLEGHFLTALERAGDVSALSRLATDLPKMSSSQFEAIARSWTFDSCSDI